MIRALTFGVVLATLAALPLAGHAQDVDAPPEPEQNPARAETPAGTPAETPEPEEPNLPGEKPTVAWSDAEVAAAKAACTKMLAGMSIDYEPLPPIKEGICGTAAPILVRSIGADPAVEISPPATMQCGLAVALDGWLKERVQPQARAMLGAAVVRVRNATSYSCRNRYGGANTRISEHALANALDISEFVLASGERITVLQSWHVASSPPLLPPVPAANPARLASAPIPPETMGADETTGAVVAVSTTRTVGSTILEVTKVRANPFVRPVAPPIAQPPRSALPQAASISLARGRGTVDLAKVKSSIKSNPFVSPLPLPQLQATPVSEPVPPPRAAVEPEPAAQPLPEPKVTADSAFVHSVHAEACKVFGTVLGPEANEVHRDHFHLDMKARRHASFCE